MKQILVSAGVIVKNGRVLMAQRMPDDSEGLKWEFPGGKVEAGEAPDACLQRELMEELEIGAGVDRVLDVFSVVKGDRQIILIYYLCHILQGEPQAIECRQFGWFRADEVDQLEKPRADTLFWSKHRGRLEVL